MVPDPGKRTISVVIKNKDGTLFEGVARALTSYNEKGIFDVLPMHENFISVVRDFIRIYKTDGKKQDMRITSGVLKVLGNKVDVYIGFET
jgi:F0F1-type ATP synthase epsilon subunit